MILSICPTRLLIMIYTFNTSNENGADSQILPLKSKLNLIDRDSRYRYR